MQNTAQNRGICHRQLLRMARLANFPTEVESVKELVDTLIDNCRDEQHVAATVTVWVRTMEWAPRPADLVMQAMAFPEQRPTFDACRQCQNSGIAAKRVLVTRRTHGPGYDMDPLPAPRTESEWEAQKAQILPGQDIYEVADWCDCGLGRWRKQQDLARQAAQADAVKVAQEKQLARRANQLAKMDFKAAAAGRD
jgi:hypothetical protein